MSRTTFIGEAPGQAGPAGGALAGRAGKTIAGLLGIAPATFLARFRRVNLLDAWPGKQGKGDAFRPATAKGRAARLAKHPVRLVLLGKRVATAFGVRAFVNDKGIEQ